MASLNHQQLQSLQAWASEGATLNEIQTRLKEEFQLNLTYFDTRLLIMENGITLRDLKREEAERLAKQQAEEEAEAQRLAAENPAALEAEEDQIETQPGPPVSNLEVTLDQINIPGTMASGFVTFSDQVKAIWYIDQYGQLGLRDTPPGYQPPTDDIPAFQQQLHSLLGSR